MSAVNGERWTCANNVVTQNFTIFEMNDKEDIIVIKEYKLFNSGNQSLSEHFHHANIYRAIEAPQHTYSRQEMLCKSALQKLNQSRIYWRANEKNKEQSDHQQTTKEILFDFTVV